MIGNKLKQLLKNRKMTQKDLSEKADINLSQLNLYINNKREPSNQPLKRIAHALNVSVYQLLEGVDTGNTQLIKNLVKVPVIGKIPAGEPIEAVQDFVGTMYIPEHEIKGDNYFGLEVQGDSMYPKFLPGDYVLISSDLCCDNGDVVACRFCDSGHVTLKKYVEDETGVIILLPENPKYTPIVVSEKIEILGKVIFMQRKV